MTKRLVNWLTYPPIEFASTEANSPCQSTFKAKLAEWWKALKLNLIDSLEMRVWRRCDRAGNVWWNAYDPKTGQSIYGISEMEMRIWVERH